MKATRNRLDTRPMAAHPPSSNHPSPPPLASHFLSITFPSTSSTVHIQTTLLYVIPPLRLQWLPRQTWPVAITDVGCASVGQLSAAQKSIAARPSASASVRGGKTAPIDGATWAVICQRLALTSALTASLRRENRSHHYAADVPK